MDLFNVKAMGDVECKYEITRLGVFLGGLLRTSLVSSCGVSC